MRLSTLLVKMYKMYKLIFIILFVKYCYSADNDNLYERCLDGYTYRFRSDDVTLPELSKILAIAYPNALYVSRQTDSVYVSLKNEENYLDIRAALGDLHIKIEYVNLLIKYQDFLDVQTYLDKYNIVYQYGEMEQFFNPVQCEVYIPPSEGGGGGPVSDKILESLESIKKLNVEANEYLINLQDTAGDSNRDLKTIKSTTTDASDYLKKIQDITQESDGYLKTIEGIVKTAVGITKTLANIYQGSYQIYQFLTGASGRGAGEICPLDNAKMEVKPPLPLPPDQKETVFGAPQEILLRNYTFGNLTLSEYFLGYGLESPLVPPIPPGGNNYGFLIETLSHISSKTAELVFDESYDPSKFLEGHQAMEIFDGAKGKTTFGLDWTPEARSKWIEYMKLNDPNIPNPAIYITLQNENGGGRKGDPMEFPTASSVEILLASFTSSFLPYKYELRQRYTCPGEPAKCEVYYQLIINRDELVKFLKSQSIDCV